MINDVPVLIQTRTQVIKLHNFLKRTFAVLNCNDLENLSLFQYLLCMKLVTSSMVEPSDEPTLVSVT